MYDIIIPNWNQSGFAIKLLESIKKHSKDYRVIFVDNGSEKAELALIEPVLRTIPHLLIKNKKNMGFVKAVNQGLSAATAPYIVLQNNDTEVVHNWLPRLQSAIDNNEGAGISGPRTNAEGSWQGKWTKKNGDLVLGDSAMLAFFCTMFKKELIDQVGLLDEDYGVGFADDDDYCDRAKKLGWKLVLAQDLMIPHYHNATFDAIYSKEEIKDMKEANLAMFQKKTGKKLSGSPNLDTHITKEPTKEPEVKRYVYLVSCEVPLETLIPDKNKKMVKMINAEKL